jgi:DNA polymerase III alpha subunit (gram-positive type)
MNVNRIDLKVHDTKAVPYKEGGSKLYNWLREMTNAGQTKAVVVGHGVYGDVEWIIHYLISRGSWETFTSYRKLDTSAVCQFLKSCNLFPETVSGSLVSLAQHFGIEVDENEAHSAKYDTILTYKVFLELRKILTTNKPSIVDNFGNVV